jgi:ribose-phosphate pyrophosphokinase
MADLLAAVRFERLVSIDLHSAPIEGCFAFPVEHLTAVPLLAERLRSLLGPRSILVAPDLGAVKLAERYARVLELPVAIVHKRRLSGTEVTTRGLIGDVADRDVIVVDDMISTGGTIEAAIRAIEQAGGHPGAIVVASHLLMVEPAATRLERLAVRQLLGTDSTAMARVPGVPTEIVSLALSLGQTIEALHRDRPLTELGSHA